MIAIQKYTSKTIHLREGAFLKIEVPFKANPQPEVTWEFNRKPLVTSPRLSRDVIYNMTSIVLGSAKVTDSGTYTLTLRNEHGKVTLDVKVKVTGRPTVPRDLTVKKVTDSYAVLAWETPEQDGGSDITGYVIEKRDTRRMAYVHVGSTKSREFKVTRLVEGQEYTFQVSAENDVGVGPPAELVHAVTAKTEHSNPSSF